MKVSPSGIPSAWYILGIHMQKKQHRVELENSTVQKWLSYLYKQQTTTMRPWNAGAVGDHEISRTNHS
jgi:hypothetical protein